MRRQPGGEKYVFGAQAARTSRTSHKPTLSRDWPCTAVHMLYANSCSAQVSYLEAGVGIGCLVAVDALSDPVLCVASPGPTRDSTG